ncbi:MAG: SMC family ATPase, partial [Dehalococcoidia bacterium]|nr:SMC family ATPase [Dehalococcoidia bacterium]
QRYRVIRRLSRTQSGRNVRHELDLLVAAEDGYKVISGDSIRATEAKIKEMLRMDYETFINSAFLVQGRYDEFTRKGPKERKEVIANILGLSIYDELAAEARDREREREVEAEKLGSALAELERQMAGRPADEAELARTTPQLSGLREQVGVQKELVERLREEEKSFQIKRRQLADVTERLARSQQERQEWQRKIEQCQRRIAELEKLLTEAEAVEKGYARLVEVRKTDQELGRKLTELSALDRRRTELEKAIEGARIALDTASKQVKQRTVELEQVISRGPGLEKTLATKKAELEALVREEEELKALEEKSREVAGAVASLAAEITRLDGELKAVTEKLDLLAYGDSRCPLCESVLEAHGVARLRAKFEVEAQEIRQKRMGAEQALAQKRKESLSLERSLGQKRAELERSRSVRQREVATIEKELADIARSGEELGRLKEMLKDMEYRLERREFAVEEQKRLSALERERAALGYDVALHERVRRELLELERYERLRQQVLDATRAIDEQKVLLRAAVEAEGRLATAVAGDQKVLEELVRAVEAMSGIPGRLAEAEEALRHLEKRERELGGLVAVLQEKMRHYTELEAQIKEKEKQRKEAIEEASIYKELATAFGKNGIQADLIERAIPEIEEEANRLLGRMTDGRMAVRLETQKPKKSAKGEVIETLEIIVSDELGSRNYEMFSGGEAFRINLALRIALSRLLVNRAGASLPVLIIDEGFGTQDSAAREKMVETIRSIQDEFKKIIVITHLEDLKDAFPVRINVTKTGQGSMIEVL